MLLLAAALSADWLFWNTNMLPAGLASRTGARIAPADRDSVRHAAGAPGSKNVPTAAPKERDRGPGTVFATRGAPRLMAEAPMPAGEPGLEGLAYPLEAPPNAQEGLAAPSLILGQRSNGCWDLAACALSDIPVTRGRWIDVPGLPQDAVPPVPEPKTWLMLVSGLLAAGLVARRRAGQRLQPRTPGPGPLRCVSRSGS